MPYQYFLNTRLSSYAVVQIDNRHLAERQGIRLQRQLARSVDTERSLFSARIRSAKGNLVA